MINQKFNIYIREIEKEIINFLINSQLLIGEKESTARIISYFITRKDLTQAKLRELTRFSPGTISQELNYLLERTIIQEKGKTSNGEKIYSMESIIDGFIKSYLSSVEYYLEYKKNFRRIREEFDKNREFLQDQKGYDSIYQLVNLFLDMFPVIESIIAILKEKQKETQPKI
ncbi:MAG: hypothetical protein GF317_11550 [Candidatus Lokiarchaeota archaeon]|nr:hypothetical protein [Candidatus Lokiarchaeota archaeon]MBD3200286.1 hypothetical protein [Candidatus Lokiarchaeota archaeon]